MRLENILRGEKVNRMKPGVIEKKYLVDRKSYKQLL